MLKISWHRAGLASIIETGLGCSITGQFSPDEFAADTTSIAALDVVVWDLGSTSNGALDPLSDLFSDSPEDNPATVVLVAEPSQAGDVWAAGARVVLSRSVSIDQIGAALLAATQHLWAVDPSVAPSAFSLLPRSTDSPAIELTPRELEVLQLLAEGLSNKEIARGLGVSEHTAKFHINAIMGKLGVQSRTEAVVRATRIGLIML